MELGRLLTDEENKRELRNIAIVLFIIALVIATVAIIGLKNEQTQAAQPLETFQQVPPFALDENFQVTFISIEGSVNDAIVVSWIDQAGSSAQTEIGNAYNVQDFTVVRRWMIGNNTEEITIQLNAAVPFRCSVAIPKGQDLDPAVAPSIAC
jgi:hypothetical protein